MRNYPTLGSSAMETKKPVLNSYLIRRLADERGWTQETLAEKVGRHPSAIGKLLKLADGGRFSRAQTRLVPLLAEAFGVEPRELFMRPSKAASEPAESS